jgi:copper homeostasis protein
MLTQLHQQANKRIVILPGGGINEANASLFKNAGFTEIHASASALVQETEIPKISMNSPKFFQENKVYESNAEIICRILKKLD